MREIGEGNRFSWLTPWFTFDLTGERRFVNLEILKKLNFCYNHKREEITHPLPQTNLRHLQVWETIPQRCFLYQKLFLLNSWKISRKFPITEIDFSNVTTLLKFLSVVDIILRIVLNTLSAAFHQMKIKGFYLKLLFWFSEGN